MRKSLGYLIPESGKIQVILIMKHEKLIHVLSRVFSVPIKNSMVIGRSKTHAEMKQWAVRSFHIKRTMLHPCRYIYNAAFIEDNGLVAEAHFDIDRTRWKVIYGSTRFFEHLGMHLVFDLISFQVKIVARK